MRHPCIPLGILVTVFICAGCGGADAPYSPLTDTDSTAWRSILPEDTAGIDLPFVFPESPEAIVERLEAQNAREELQKNTSLAAAVQYWQNSGITRWNELARGLVAKYRTPPPKAARVYALVSVAQYDALLVARQIRHDRPMVRPEDELVAGTAAAVILKASFPDDSGQINSLLSQQLETRLATGDCVRTDLTNGRRIGTIVAERVLDFRADDGANVVWNGDPALPQGEGFWYPDTGNGLKPPAPVLPLWGKVRPWFITNVVALRPPPPPSIGSPEFRSALSEVHQISDSRTAEQIRIARFWADGPGTATPPGHWNQIACDLAAEKGLSELQKARMLAYLNIAQMDASICCWDAKYSYALLRPSQADPAITLPVGLPNFPSYTSGHSTFSGASSQVLSYFFPEESQEMNRLAEEASISRVYGGIHYRFDCETGLRMGRNIGTMAVMRARAEDVQ